MDRAVRDRPLLKGFVLNLLNTTVVDFVAAAVLHSSKLLCFLGRWISPKDFIHMDLLARLRFAGKGKPLELAR